TSLALIASRRAVKTDVLALDGVACGGAGQRRVGLAPPQIHNRALVAVEHGVGLRLLEIAELDRGRAVRTSQVRRIDVEALALDGVVDATDVAGNIRESRRVENARRQRRAGEIRAAGVDGCLINISNAGRDAALFHVAEEVAKARANHQFRSRSPVGAEAVDRVRIDESGIGAQRVRVRGGLRVELTYRAVRQNQLARLPAIRVVPGPE